MYARSRSRSWFLEAGVGVGVRVTENPSTAQPWTYNDTEMSCCWNVKCVHTIFRHQNLHLNREMVISWLLVSSQDLVASGSLKFPGILWFSGASDLLISQPVGCLNRSRFSESF